MPPHARKAKEFLSDRPLAVIRIKKYDCTRIHKQCLRHGMRCGATMLMNSRDVITLVFFQNFGKCLVFPVTR